MSVATQQTLNDKTIRAVQELIEVNVDSYNGFNQAAKQIDDPSIAQVFHDLSEDRLAQAVELQKLVIRDDEQPLSKGTIAGRIHRAIMDWRTSLGGGASMILKEAERGEDYIKAKYEAILSQTAGSPVTNLLNRQYAAVTEAHERVCDLHNAITTN